MYMVQEWEWNQVVRMLHCVVFLHSTRKWKYELFQWTLVGACLWEVNVFGEKEENVASISGNKPKNESIIIISTALLEGHAYPPYLMCSLFPAAFERITLVVFMRVGGCRIHSTRWRYLNVFVILVIGVLKYMGLLLMHAWRDIFGDWSLGWCRQYSSFYPWPGGTLISVNHQEFVLRWSGWMPVVDAMCIC